MKHGPLIFLGLFFAMACSWCGLILAPHLQIGTQVPVLVEETGQLYPGDRPGQAHQGQEVYRANGCFYCHTRNVRGIDTPRLGPRISVASDYLFDQPVMLGNLRIGPDLANVGSTRRDLRWHLLHLYDPQSIVKGSIMPPYRFLFEKRKISGTNSVDALVLTGRLDPGKGYEIVPKPEAYALVAYLLSQRSELALADAPICRSPLESGSTNATAKAAAAGTNAPAQPAAAAAQPGLANPPAAKPPEAPK